MVRNGHDIWLGRYGWWQPFVALGCWRLYTSMCCNTFETFCVQDFCWGKTKRFKTKTRALEVSVRGFHSNPHCTTVELPAAQPQPLAFARFHGPEEAFDWRWSWEVVGDSHFSRRSDSWSNQCWQLVLAWFESQLWRQAFAFKPLLFFGCIALKTRLEIPNREWYTYKSICIREMICLCPLQDVCSCRRWLWAICRQSGASWNECSQRPYWRKLGEKIQLVLSFQKSCCWEAFGRVWTVWSMVFWRPSGVNRPVLKIELVKLLVWTYRPRRRGPKKKSTLCWSTWSLLRWTCPIVAWQPQHCRSFVMPCRKLFRRFSRSGTAGTIGL